jgi:hypothetical protein
MSARGRACRATRRQPPVTLTKPVEDGRPWPNPSLRVSRKRPLRHRPFANGGGCTEAIAKSIAVRIPAAHQEARVNRRDFLRHRIPRHFSSLPRQGPVSVDDPRIPRAIPGASCRKSLAAISVSKVAVCHMSRTPSSTSPIAATSSSTRSSAPVRPIAADKTGRVCRGLEFDPLYVDVIVRRYEAGAIPRRRLRPPRSPTFESSDPTECC